MKLGAAIKNIFEDDFVFTLSDCKPPCIGPEECCVAGQCVPCEPSSTSEPSSSTGDPSSSSSEDDGGWLPSQNLISTLARRSCFFIPGCRNPQAASYNPNCYATQEECECADGRCLEPSSTSEPSSSTGDPSSSTGDPSSSTGDPSSSTGDPSSSTGDPSSSTGDPSSSTDSSSSSCEKGMGSICTDFGCEDISKCDYEIQRGVDCDSNPELCPDFSTESCATASLFESQSGSSASSRCSTNYVYVCARGSCCFPMENNLWNFFYLSTVADYPTFNECCENCSNPECEKTCVKGWDCINGNCENLYARGKELYAREIDCNFYCENPSSSSTEPSSSSSSTEPSSSSTEPSSSSSGDSSSSTSEPSSSTSEPSSSTSEPSSSSSDGCCPENNDDSRILFCCPAGNSFGGTLNNSDTCVACNKSSTGTPNELRVSNGVCECEACQCFGANWSFFGGTCKSYCCDPNSQNNLIGQINSDTNQPYCDENNSSTSGSSSTSASSSSSITTSSSSSDNDCEVAGQVRVTVCNNECFDPCPPNKEHKLINGECVCECVKDISDCDPGETFNEQTCECECLDPKQLVCLLTGKTRCEEPCPPLTKDAFGDDLEVPIPQIWTLIDGKCECASDCGPDQVDCATAFYVSIDGNRRCNCDPSGCVPSCPTKSRMPNCNCCATVQHPNKVWIDAKSACGDPCPDDKPVRNDQGDCIGCDELNPPKELCRGRCVPVCDTTNEPWKDFTDDCRCLSKCNNNGCYKWFDAERKCVKVSEDMPDCKPWETLVKDANGVCNTCFEEPCFNGLPRDPDTGFCPPNNQGPVGGNGAGGGAGSGGGSGGGGESDPTGDGQCPENSTIQSDGFCYCNDGFVMNSTFDGCQSAAGGGGGGGGGEGGGGGGGGEGGGDGSSSTSDSSSSGSGGGSTSSSSSGGGSTSSSSSGGGSTSSSSSINSTPTPTTTSGGIVQNTPNVPTATLTATPTATLTATPTATLTATPTATLTATPTDTNPTPTPTNTKTPAPTNPTPTPTNTKTPAPTNPTPTPNEISSSSSSSESQNLFDSNLIQGQGTELDPWTLSVNSGETLSLTAISSKTIELSGSSVQNLFAQENSIGSLKINDIEFFNSNSSNKVALRINAGDIVEFIAQGPTNSRFDFAFYAIDLFDKQSWSSIQEPYKSYLDGAADRWNKYIAYNPQIKQKIKNYINAEQSSSSTELNGWNGLSLNLNQFLISNDSESGIIASCGPWDYYDLEISTSSVKFNSVTFQLEINDHYRNIFDANDWINILTHELGHALGIGVYWSSELEIDGAVPPVGFFLDGSNYVNCGVAYDSITGDVTDRNKIPLEDAGGDGTASAHWESDYRDASYPGSEGYTYPGVTNELMVGFYAPGQTSILSLLSIKTLVDFGYVETRSNSSEGIPETSLISGQSLKSQNCMKLTCQHKTKLNKLGTISVDE